PKTFNCTFSTPVADISANPAAPSTHRPTTQPSAANESQVVERGEFVLLGGLGGGVVAVILLGLDVNCVKLRLGGGDKEVAQLEIVQAGGALVNHRLRAGALV